MKKVLATILAFLYLATSTGATMHLHYCMGKLVSWGLVNQSSAHCSFCGMPKKATTQHCVAKQKDCCKDEQKQIKTDKDQKLTPVELQGYKLFSEAPAVNYPTLFNIDVLSFAVDYPTANAPPTIRNLPVFLLNCNLRI